MLAFYNSIAFADVGLFFGLFGANLLARGRSALASLALLATLLTYEAGVAVAALPRGRQNPRLRPPAIDMDTVGARRRYRADHRTRGATPPIPDQRLTASLTPDLLHGMAVRFTLFVPSIFKILWFSANEVFRSQYASAFALSAFSVLGELPHIVFDVPDSNSLAVIEPKLAVDSKGRVDVAADSFRILPHTIQNCVQGTLLPCAGPDRRRSGWPRSWSTARSCSCSRRSLAARLFRKCRSRVSGAGCSQGMYDSATAFGDGNHRSQIAI